MQWELWTFKGGAASVTLRTDSPSMAAHLGGILGELARVVGADRCELRPTYTATFVGACS